jgi:aminoglycoside phosphotransferase (APT) family kinase protein
MDIENPAELISYLRGRGHLGPEESAGCRLLVGGVSNKTVLVRRGGGDWVVKQALPALRVAAEWLADPARIHREAIALQHLVSVLPEGACPRLVFHHPEDFVLAMEAVPEPHANLKSLLMSGALADEAVERFGLMLGDLLGRLHAATSDGDARWKTAFGDRRYFESLRIDPYYRHTLAAVPEAAGWLAPLLTTGEPMCVVHGDFSPKNMLVYHARLVLLDYEVTHFGDAAFDLGFCLTHLLSKAHHHRRAAFGRAAGRFVAAWAEQTAKCPWFEGAVRRAPVHTLACLLARVHGKSPLEYLTSGQRARQSSVVLQLARGLPTPLERLLSDFTEAVL